MLKISPQLAGTVLATDVDNSKVVGSSSRNNRKSAKSGFTKLVYGVEELSFLTPNARQVFTQLRQMFTEALIFQHFDTEYHIQIETNAFSYAICGVFS